MNLKKEIETKTQQRNDLLREAGERGCSPRIAHESRESAEELGRRIAELARKFRQVEQAREAIEHALEALPEELTRDLALARTHLEDALHRVCRALGCEFK